MNQNSHLSPNDKFLGENTKIRLPSIEEIPFIRFLWSDIETMSPVGGPVEFPDKRSIAWFEWMVYPGTMENCYCLIINKQDNPIGEISFHGWVPEKLTARLNIKVLASKRGNGYAKDALRTFLSFFFYQVGGVLITDDVALENKSGQAFLTSFGFEKAQTKPGCFPMEMSRDNYAMLYQEANQSLDGTARSSAAFL